MTMNSTEGTGPSPSTTIDLGQLVIATVSLPPIIVVGSFCNIVTVVAILTNKAMSHSDFFTICIASVDLLVCACILPAGLANAYLDNRLFDSLPACNVIGFVYTVAEVGCCQIIALYAIDCYLRICHNGFYKAQFKRSVVLTMIIIGWLNALAMVTATSAVYNDRGFMIEERMLFCEPDTRAIGPFAMLLVVVAAVYVPIGIALACFVGIYRFHSTESSNDLLFKTILTICLVFLLTPAPYWFVVLAENIAQRDLVNKYWYQLSFYLFQVAHVLNPMICAHFNAKYRNGYRRVFRAVCPGSVKG